MEAKKILCVTEKGLSEENERFLNELDIQGGDDHRAVYRSERNKSGQYFETAGFYM